MTPRDDLFALIGEDVDFIGDIVRTDVPVLSYRWSNSEAVARVKPATLLRWGRDSMVELGLTNIRWQGRHLRGDSMAGQRVKMTVLSCNNQSIYLLMTAGLPGTREAVRDINRRLSERIERRGCQWNLRNPASVRRLTGQPKAMVSDSGHKRQLTDTPSSECLDDQSNPSIFEE